MSCAAVAKAWPGRIPGRCREGRGPAEAAGEPLWAGIGTLPGWRQTALSPSCRGS